ncbi:MAG: helix-turn-helix domain-containing protein [Solirubrobacterales bacterium]|nr:helix-turn-helix domain-containing protein [Solirubrobacterales bacterium]
MAANDADDSFLTVAEVAATLKLNQQTVRNWIDQGSLPALRVGRRVRIRRSDFERLLTDSYTGAAGATKEEDGGPTAEDFWGGEPVGVAEPAPSTLLSTIRPAESSESAPSPSRDLDS